MGVAKLDNNLNIVWLRYCMEPGFDHMPNLIMSLADGGLVVGGYKKGVVQGHISPKMFYLFFHEDGTGVSETEARVRPYLFWPNPVQDALHIHYSPDITPTGIALYDLQGRQVRNQKNDLEILGMSGLPSGTYMMRVLLEDGQVFSDQVVKE